MHEETLHSPAYAGAGRLRLVLLLTATYTAIEAVGGLMTGSLALLADAGHVFVDVLGMTVALLAIQLGSRQPTLAKTYGYYRLEILAALLNGMLMIAIAIYILFEAIGRFSQPPQLAGLQILAFALPGLLVNLTAAALLFESQKHSLNLRGAFLEVASDLVGSLAVVLAGGLTYATGFHLADPIASVGIALFILPRTWTLISAAIHILLEGTPSEVDVTQVREHILGVRGVVDLHDLHIWNLTSGMNVVSAHVVIDQQADAAEVLDTLSGCLGDHFDIQHTTFQIEKPDRRETERSVH